MGIDRHGERRPEARGILRGLQMKIERLTPTTRQGEAKHAPPVLEHEVDGLGCDLVGRNDQIALIFASLVVTQDDHPTFTKILERLFEGRKRRHLFFGHGHDCLV